MFNKKYNDAEFGFNYRIYNQKQNSTPNNINKTKSIDKKAKLCICGGPELCLLASLCLHKNLIYRCTVTYKNTSN